MNLYEKGESLSNYIDQLSDDISSMEPKKTKTQRPKKKSSIRSSTSNFADLPPIEKDFEPYHNIS